MRSASWPRTSPPRRAAGWSCWRNSTTAGAGRNGASDRARTGSRGDVRWDSERRENTCAWRIGSRSCQLVKEAFSRGELSYCKVRALTRVATPATEAGLLEIARHATGAQLEKLIRGYAGALSATLGAAQRAIEGRYLRWNWEDDGSLRLEARLPADDGAVVLNALRAAEAERSEARCQRSRCWRRRRGAPARMRWWSWRSCRAAAGCRSVAVARMGASSSCTWTRRPWRRMRSGERCHLADGPTLSPETVRRLGCDAGVVRIVERDGRPLTVGRRTRTIPPALRRALRSRDAGCRFPGCTHERFLHAHHIRHWAKGGPTTLENLVQLCSYHHRLVHEGGFRVESLGPRRGAVPAA